QQYRVEGGWRVLQVPLHKTSGASGRRQVNGVGRSHRALQTLFFLAEKILPGVEKVIGGDAKTALNEKVQRRLPRRAKIEERSPAEAVQVPQKFLQAVRRTIRSGRSRAAVRPGCHRRRPCAARVAGRCARRRFPGNIAAGASAS